MLPALLHYLTYNPVQFSRSYPTILELGYYPVRVVIAEWMMYTHVLSRYVKHYEYSLRSIQDRLHDDDIIDLQRWRRRTKQSNHKLALLSDFIECWLEREGEKMRWKMVLKDVEFIRGQIDHQSRSLEQMLPVATSMVQLREASNVQRLTYIALIFVPLSWVASVFSMAEGYGPGERLFWVYFVTAIPLLSIVVAIALGWQALHKYIVRFEQKL